MTQHWWSDAVVYQIYPRSFVDSNSDGIGDLAGVLQKLPYLKQLGIDAIWLSPFYPSPMRDSGYDISDPRNVDPTLGTLQDVDDLIAASHNLGIRVIVDVVPNHISSEHVWFQQALQSRPGSVERMRFHFLDGVDGGPPNNWISVFGGPAWTQITEIDGQKGQWYLHLFDSGQPDVNWTNPEVSADFEETLRFWLDRGVDGFRVDVALALAKDMTYASHSNPEKLVDAIRLDLYDPSDPEASREIREHLLNSPIFDRNEVHDILRKWRSILKSYDGDRFAVAEAWAYPTERAMEYARSLGQVFNFDFMVVPFEAHTIHETAQRIIQHAIDFDASPTWVLSNHDNARVATRLGGGVEGLDRARAMAVVSATLPGSMYVYQGDELGLEDGFVAPQSRMDPIWERSGRTNPGRDGCRIPLPWNAQERNYGFSSADHLWLPQDSSWQPIAADIQESDPLSTLNLYRQMFGLRHHHPAWNQAMAETVLDVDGSLLSIERAGQVVCLLNTGHEMLAIEGSGSILLASHPDVEQWQDVSSQTLMIALPQNSAVIIEKNSQPNPQVEI